MQQHNQLVPDWTSLSEASDAVRQFVKASAKLLTIVVDVVNVSILIYLVQLYALAKENVNEIDCN